MPMQLTEGARLLRPWLRARGLNIPSFCEAKGLDRIQLQRAMRGAQKRFSVDFALAIFRATDGAVPLEAWASETARPVEGGEATEAAESDPPEGDEGP